MLPREASAPRAGTLSLDPATWEQILLTVRTQHPSLNRVWFDQMKPRQLTNGVIQVTVATPAQLNFCQGQCQQPFNVRRAAGHRPAGRRSAFTATTLPEAVSSMKETSRCRSIPITCLSIFVTGPCNRLPHAACIAVAEQPGKAYNPLFIHGGVGLGKTHLLQAVCQKCWRRIPTHAFSICPATPSSTSSSPPSRTGDMNQFRYRYRNVDMLVIDDIHFLAGPRSHAGRILPHVQHALSAAQADHPQRRLPAERNSGTGRAARVSASTGAWSRASKSRATKRASRSCRRRRACAGWSLPDDVVCYIAAKVENNTRELEGAITKLQGMSLLHNGKIDLELAKARPGRIRAPRISSGSRSSRSSTPSPNTTTCA